MVNNQQLLNLITVGLLVLGAESAIAQSTGNSSASTDDSTTQVLFKPPPDDKKPDITTGAGSRRVGRASDILGLSAKTSAKHVVLNLRESGTQHHSQTFFPITGAPNVIGIKPSDDSPALEVGKNYQWAVVLVCGERPGPNDPAIASVVRRVAPPERPSSKFYQKTGLEQALWYSEQGIWYDDLNALAQTLRSQPHNNTQAGIWADFLKSAGLGAISTNLIPEKLNNTR